MTIRNLNTYMNNLWDWGILNGCFGNTRIAVSDVDGLVERRGKFLLLEAKSPGKDIPKGQEYTFQSLIGTGVFTILVIWGSPNQPQQIKIITSKKTIFVNNADVDKLKQIVSEWYTWASKPN